jgi:hypothetical protein
MLNSLIVGLGFFVGGSLLVRFLENGEPHLLFISIIVIIFASLNLGIILQKRYG